MRRLLIPIIACLSSLVGVQATYAFTFGTDPTRMVGESVSVVPLWAQGTTEAGDTLSEYCVEFLAQMQLRLLVSQPQCWYIIGSLNGLTSQNELDTLAIGQKIWLPAPQNSSKEILERCWARVAVEDFGVSPLGQPSELRVILMGEDDISRLLAEWEAKTLSVPEVEALAKRVFRENPRVTTAQLEAALEDFRTELAAKSLPRGVSTFEVTTLIANAFKAANLSDQATISAIQSAKKDLGERLAVVEAALATKADTSTVEALERELDRRLNAASEQIERDLGPSGRVQNMVENEVKLAVGDALDDLPVTPLSLLPTAEESNFKTLLREYMPWLALFSLVVALLTLWLFVTSRNKVRWVEAEVAKSTTSVEAIAARVASAADSAALSKTAAESSAVAAAAVSVRALREVGELTERVEVLEEGYESTSRLLNILFDKIFGLHPEQDFPTEKAIDELEVGRTIVLTFADDKGRSYSLRLTKEEGGLYYLQGLNGRTVVPLANAMNVILTIRKAFEQAQMKGSVTSAFKAEVIKPSAKTAVPA